MHLYHLKYSGIRSGEIGGSYGWREAFVKDPNGIWIELVQRK